MAPGAPNPNPTPTPGPTPTPTPSPSSVQQFLFAPMGNNPAPNPADRLMAEFRIDGNSGALSVVNPSLSAQNLASWSWRDPGHKFLYVEGAARNTAPPFIFDTISGYTVNQANGAISAMPGSPFNFNQQELAFATVRPDLKFMYVEDFMSPGILHILSMDPNTGALLQEVATIQVASEQNASVLARGAFDSSGRYLYLENAEADNIAGFVSDPATGLLTSIPGSPFTPRAAMPGFCSPKQSICGGALAVTGNVMLLVSQFLNGVSEFVIDPATGALTETTNSPFPAQANGFSELVTPNGKFLYVLAPGDGGANGSGLVLGYAIDSTGNLTTVPGSPFAVSGQDFFGDLDETGNFLYVSAGAGIAGFRIDQNSGTLSAVPGSPAPVNGVTGITVVH